MAQILILLWLLAMNWLQLHYVHVCVQTVGETQVTQNRHWYNTAARPRGQISHQFLGSSNHSYLKPTNIQQLSSNKEWMKPEYQGKIWWIHSENISENATNYSKSGWNLDTMGKSDENVQKTPQTMFKIPPPPSCCDWDSNLQPSTGDSHVAGLAAALTS